MPKSEISEYLKHIKYIRRLSPHTLIAYKTDLKQFKSYYRKNLLIAERKDIIDFISFLKENSISNRSIRRKIEALKSFYYFNIKNSYIKSSPCILLPRIKFNKPIIEYIKQEIIISVLDSFDPGENRKKIRDKLILELLYFTGCRLDEIINLKKKNIDCAKLRIKVIGKGKKERIALINQSILLLMTKHTQKWKSKNRTRYLLNDDRGKKTYPMFVWRLINKYFSLEKVGVNASAHIIRHSIATHLYNNGASIYDIQKFLGHTFLISTSGYIHLEPEIILKVYREAHPKS